MLYHGQYRSAMRPAHPHPHATHYSAAMARLMIIFWTSLVPS